LWASLCLFSTSSPDDIVGFVEWCGDTIDWVETVFGL
jgi:hypothetical protein